MGKTTDNIKIKGVGFDEYSEPDTSIITKENFEASGKWLILSSFAIPKDTKTYMELVITDNIIVDMIRHIPIYLGVHKEPSAGILNTDCIFMSCYYSIISDFEIFERHKHVVDGQQIITMNNQEAGSIKSKLPIINSVIGLGVDCQNNTITIYNDSKEFYTFSPELFNLADEGDWYFAIYSNQSISIKGKINFGRYKTTYIPDDYYTLYQIYYPSLYKSSYSKYEEPEPDPYTDYTRLTSLIPCYMSVSNESFPIDQYTHSRTIKLEHSIGSGNTADNSFKFTANRTAGKSDISSINLTCPRVPVYCELQVLRATLKTGYVGIPIEVGLTIKKNNTDSSSFRVALYHMRGAEYMSYSVYNGEQLYYILPQPNSPIPPVQPNTIGFIFDRLNNMISIVTGGSVFVNVPIQGIDTSNLNDDYYIFFKSADEAYIGTLDGYVTLGDEGTAFDIPNQAVSVYDYWNAGIYYELDSYPELRCRMNVLDPSIEAKREVLCQIQVTKDEDQSPGLNLLFNTFNTISDTDPHNIEPDSNESLEEMMKADNKF